MKRAHRHTIMDGRVVTFSTDFTHYENKGIMGMSEAIGAFDVSASRNAVVVHRAEIKTEADLQNFIDALDLAYREKRFLAGCDGRPDDNDLGQPREV